MGGCIFFAENDHHHPYTYPGANSKVGGDLKKEKEKNIPEEKVPGGIFRKAHANARNFPIFIQFLCSNTIFL